MFKAVKEVVVDSVVYPVGAEVPAALVTTRMIQLGMVTECKEESCTQVEEALLEDRVEVVEESQVLLIDDSSDVVIDED